MKYWDQDIWIVNSLSVFSPSIYASPLGAFQKFYFLMQWTNDNHCFNFGLSFISSHIIIDCGFILFSLINSHIITKNIHRLLVTIIDHCGKNIVFRYTYNTAQRQLDACMRVASWATMGRPAEFIQTGAGARQHPQL